MTQRQTVQRYFEYINSLIRQAFLGGFVSGRLAVKSMAVAMRPGFSIQSSLN
jgi:hypothetical protein